jgi:hypothetical protein
VSEKVVATISTGRIVPMLKRIEDEESGLTKFTLHFMEEEPPVLLFFSGPGDQADHTWIALDLVARSFDPNDDVIAWTLPREIVGAE